MKAGGAGHGSGGRGSKPKPIRAYRTYARPEESQKRGSWARLALRAVIVLVVATGAYFLFFFRAGSDDAQIRQLVEEGRQLFEAKELGSFMDLISEDYKDRSDFNKQTVHAILFRLFQSPHTPRAEISNVQVRRSGDEAVVLFDAKVAIGEGEAGTHLLIGQAAPRLITIQCRKEEARLGMGGRWRVIESEGWEDADFQP